MHEYNGLNVKRLKLLVDFRKMINYKKKIFNVNVIPGTFSTKWPEMF